MHEDIWMGFEAEFVSVVGDYMEVAPLVEPIAGVPVEALTMFDDPDWDSGCWYVCQDSSIIENGGDGVEIISSPMAVRDCLDALKQTLILMRSIGHSNDSCALHINLSSPRLPTVRKVYDNFDAPRWLTEFGRDESDHARMLTEDHNELNKELVVNRHGLTHIEFKHIGGHSYLTNDSLTNAAVLGALFAYQQAVDKIAA